MKKLAAKKNVECMACLQCVAACSEAFYKEFDEEKSCVRIVAKGTGAKPNTCIQCGKCMRTCEHEAITQNPKTGVYMINKKKCVGCGKCAEACPMHVIVFEAAPPPSALPAASASKHALWNCWKSWRNKSSNRMGSLWLPIFPFLRKG